MRNLSYFSLFLGALFLLSGTSLFAQQVPSIDSQNFIPTVDEDNNVTIDIAHLEITDDDPPAHFTLNIKEGSDYTIIDVDNTIILPNANLNGQISVTVTVSDINDGESNECYQHDDINPANALPMITDQANTDVEIAEETTRTINPTDFVIEDPDAGDTHTVVVEAGSNYTFLDNTATPDDDYFGPLQVNLRVNDGTGSSDQFVYLLTVTNVNDAPTLDVVNNVLLEENGSPGDALLSG